MQLRNKNESKIGKNEVRDGPNSGEVDVDGTEYFETQENFETQGNDDFEQADFNFDVAGEISKKSR